MKLFFRPRTVPVPTTLGSLSLAGLFLAPLLFCIWWFFRGESYLASTHRVPNAEILVIEGWIGPGGIAAAKEEFEAYPYKLIAISGGIAQFEGWSQGGWSYAERAKIELIRLGIPKEKIVAATENYNPARQRTYQSAATVVQTLAEAGIRPGSANVFSLGTHAQRSFLVYEKAFGPKTKVGIVTWQRPDPKIGWWHSSERAQQLMVQSVGYFYEFLFNSGRKA